MEASSVGEGQKEKLAEESPLGIQRQGKSSSVDEKDATEGA